MISYPDKFEYWWKQYRHKNGMQDNELLPSKHIAFKVWDEFQHEIATLETEIDRINDALRK